MQIKSDVNHLAFLVVGTRSCSDEARRTLGEQEFTSSEPGYQPLIM